MLENLKYTRASADTFYNKAIAILKNYPETEIETEFHEAIDVALLHNDYSKKEADYYHKCVNEGISRAREELNLPKK